MRKVLITLVILMLAILVWYGNKDKGKIFLDLTTDKIEEAVVTSPGKQINRILDHEEVTFIVNLLNKLDKNSIKEYKGPK
ncbi:hypothetical protein [Desnuesiella massiliensis]|uniref:hypothetical protein n=1 Tax=Desnuesiella massiliensis TaxID=1650662 RepID=UPI0006E2D02C|nr:hypothetical protein [Desnuesiella massiliensis]